MAEGKADVGAFGSEEFDKLMEAEPEVANKVNVLWRSGDIPLGPVVYNQSLPTKHIECLQSLLLNLHQTNRAVLESIKGGWTEAIPADRYVEIKNADYERWLKENGTPEQILPILQKFAK